MIIVTHNQNKYMEYEEMFLEKGMELEWFNYEYPEIQSDSLKEIAEFSMKYVSKLINKPFFLEDTGLFISTLNGFPGPYSSYVQSKIGNKGILKLLEGKDKLRHLILEDDPKPYTHLDMIKIFQSLKVDTLT
ncbi:MAG: non-canonical purine NTP pyrophosphatase, partial [Thermoplasmata archaeon]